jgi:hypothetical protein
METTIYGVLYDNGWYGDDNNSAFEAFYTSKEVAEKHVKHMSSRAQSCPPDQDYFWYERETWSVVELILSDKFDTEEELPF